MIAMVSLYFGIDMLQVDLVADLPRSLLLWFCHQLPGLLVHSLCAREICFSFVSNIFISPFWFWLNREVSPRFKGIKNHWGFRVPFRLCCNIFGHFSWIRSSHNTWGCQWTSWYPFPRLSLLFLDTCFYVVDSWFDIWRYFLKIGKYFV